MWSRVCLVSRSIFVIRTMVSTGKGDPRTRLDTPFLPRRMSVTAAGLLSMISLRLCARTPLSLSSSVVGLATPNSWARGRLGAPRVRRHGARSRRRGIPRVCLKRRQSAPGHVLLLDPHGVCDALLEGGHDPRHLRVLGKVVVQRVVDSVRVPLLHAGQDLFAPAFVRTQFRAEDPQP